MPESTGDEGGQSGSKTRLLALGRHSQEHVVTKPVVRVDVPVPKICVAVLCKLNPQGSNVGQTVPVRLSSLRVKALVSYTSHNAGTFRQGPHAVVFHTSYDIHHVHLEDARRNAELLVLVGEESVGVKVARA